MRTVKASPRLERFLLALVGGVNTLAGIVVGWYFGRHSDRDEVEVVNPPDHPVPTRDLPEPEFGRDR